MEAMVVAFDDGNGLPEAVMLVAFGSMEVERRLPVL